MSEDTVIITEEEQVKLLSSIMNIQQFNVKNLYIGLTKRVSNK